MAHDRAKKTLVGAGMVLLGMSMMLESPLIVTDYFDLSVGTTLVSYAIIFLAGFVVLMVGTGLVLIENNLWGELHR